jgi:ubiquinone/menaquinone biosynthesis C-methylase UbiE
MPAPLYELDPLNRFSDRASDYAKYRPSYPPEAIAQILNDLGDPTQIVAADIGAGTGISSRLLGDRGCSVWAIEPNAIMQESAVPHPLVQYQQGSAEQTGLPDASVHLVTCFQAFHWFHPETALAEFRRILKPSGRLALVWNNRDQDDAFTNEYSELMSRASNHHPALDRPEYLPKNSIFPLVREYRFTLTQMHSLDGLIGNAKSRSYIPQAGSEYEQLLLDLKALHDRWTDDQGMVSLKYQTKIFIADLPTEFQKNEAD